MVRLFEVAVEKLIKLNLWWKDIITKIFTIIGNLRRMTLQYGKSFALFPSSKTFPPIPHIDTLCYFEPVISSAATARIKKPDGVQDGLVLWSA